MKPMLANTVELHELGPYIDDDEWWVQQKVDGDRLLIGVSDGLVTAFGRAGEPKSRVPGEVIAEVSKLTPGTWWFDGELRDRVLWLFDMPAAGSLVQGDPFIERYNSLKSFMGQWRPSSCIQLLPVAIGKVGKAQLVLDVHKSGGEGVILRHVEGLYRGGRSPHLLKAKFTDTVDAVVMEVGLEGKDNCSYGLYRDGVLVPVGRCSLHGKPAVKVGDVIEVKYLNVGDAEHPDLYQPRLVRVRGDKAAGECVMGQLRLADKHTIHI